VNEALDGVRDLWQSMFTLPWQRANNDDEPWEQRTLWLLGWIWSFLGLILGAYLASPLVSRFNPLLSLFGLSNATYHDWIIYIIAALSAFVVQLVSFALFMGLYFTILLVLSFILDADPENDMRVTYTAIVAGGVLLVAGESFALWRFILTQDIHQGVVTGYVIGGFVIKAIILPALKTLIFGVIVKWVFGRKRQAQVAN
jgi:hypothetical protein